MTRYKLSMIIASILIIIISLSMILSTYAYFTIKVQGEGNDIELTTFDEFTSIVYTDTSNVTMVNAYTGDSIIKTFTIKNNSSYPLYYNILLENVVNNFENPNDLVYTLEEVNSNAVYRDESIIPTKDTSIATNVRIDANQIHSYNLKITFLKTEEDQSNNMNKTFSSNIDIIASNINIGSNLYENNTLGKMMEDNVISSYNNLNEEGIYFTNSSYNGNKIYFYVGSNNLNNNVLINDNCFKIIRTTEDNGIRLIYSGKYENNTCNNENILKNLSRFNNKANSNAYVGYMYGSPSSTDYISEHKNTNSSEIKNYLENWFKTELSNYSDLISNDTFYCNNRKTSEFIHNNILYKTLGYSGNNTGYLEMNNNLKTYDCNNIEDRFSVSNNDSSKVLTYSIGLINTNELLFSGINEYGSDSFLYSKDSYWTMTPAYYNGSGAYNFIVENGVLKECKVNELSGVRPVITLKKSVKILNGDGSIESPFVIGG